MYEIDPTYNVVVRKFDSTGSLLWMAAIATFGPVTKSWAVDNNEQKVFFVYYASPLDVVNLNSNTGGILATQRL